MTLIDGPWLLLVEAMQVITKVLWTSVQQQNLYTIFKAIGTHFGNERFVKDYRGGETALTERLSHKRDCLYKNNFSCSYRHTYLCLKRRTTHIYACIRHTEGGSW